MIKHEEILQALTDRKTWEERQATWYQMRHDGLRRRNKPWPNAADLHYPLADTLIEKQKPAYVGQVFATDAIASFTALSAGAQQWQTASGQWFDYHLKQQSNFEDELEIASDRMLQSGKAIVKVFWDAEKTRLTFECINPIYVILPSYTGKLADTDWIVHVQHYSKHAYKRLNPDNTPGGFDVSEETIKTLCDGDGTGAGDSSTLETAKYNREGITKPTRDGKIVIWELTYRAPDGSLRVKTYSPNRPNKELRPEFGLPYNRGVFEGARPALNYFELSNEAKDRGFFDARGIPERVAPFEAKLCKDWNSMGDYQTLAYAPMFYAKNGLPQGTNLRMVPGQILPFELAAVTLPTPPVDIPNGMLGTRQTAQELVGDLAWNTPAAANPKDKKTATEVSLIGSEKTQGTNLKARRFRRELGVGLNLAWGILLQYNAEKLQFFYLDEMQQLPQQALGERYKIELAGSGDNSDRALTLQKAQSRFQMFRGDPHINQPELLKSVLEADDPRLVKRLFLDAGTQSAQQLEDQASEIGNMLLGFQSQVKPSDDDGAHLQCLFGFFDRRAQMGPPVPPEAVSLMADHAAMHAQAWKKKNPQQFQQAAAQMGPKLQQLQQVGAAAKQQLQQMQQQMAMMQQQQAQGMPPGQPPMPQGQPMPGGLPQ